MKKKFKPSTLNLLFAFIFLLHTNVANSKSEEQVESTTLKVESRYGLFFGSKYDRRPSSYGNTWFGSQASGHSSSYSRPSSYGNTWFGSQGSGHSSSYSRPSSSGSTWSGSKQKEEKSESVSCGTRYPSRRRRDADSIPQLNASSTTTTTKATTASATTPVSTKGTTISSNLTSTFSELEIEKRIVGGSEIGINMHPWTVSIQSSTGSRMVHTCGGSMIHEEWVLTAAHCIPQFRDTGYWVGHSSANWKQATLVRVKTIIEHEKYDPKSKSKTNENDIALMKLERPIAFRKGLVTPICLTDKPLDRKLKAEIAGWGKLNSKSKEASDKLMQVKLNQHSDSECSNVKYFSPNKMICAGYLEGGQDACQGDSGGALVAQNPSNKKFYEIGICSFHTGTSCGGKGEHTYYTHVPNYLKWIKDKTGISSFDR